MRGVVLSEVYQFYNMCPKALPIRKPIIKKIKQIEYDKKWKQKETSNKK